MGSTGKSATRRPGATTSPSSFPGLEIRIFPEVGDAADVEYLAFMRPDFDAIPTLPKLKAMFSRSAGVEAFIDHPRLPQCPLGKIEPSGGDPMMTEYTIMHVLRFHREMPLFKKAQANREWLRRPIVRPEQRRIGFLGLGLMARAPALILKSLGFPVSAWVRSPRADEEIPIFHGADQFERFMNQTDIAVCLLPLTSETEGISVRPHLRDDAARRDGHQYRARQARRRSRSDRRARSGQLSYAALDALHPEPLPPESPLWLHPKVTVMPHVARRPTVRQLVNEIAANIRSIEAGGRLMQEIDKRIGY